MNPLMSDSPRLASALARTMALSPVRWAIKRRAFRTPHKHLADAQGKLYMGRWHLVDEAPGKPRDLLFPESAPREWSARLHHIAQPDHDRDLHNHPFQYRTFMLAGWYDEVYLDSIGVERTRRIGTGQTSYSGGAFHRIARVSPGGAWTVFVMDKNQGEWGFRTPVEYIRPKGGPTRMRYGYMDSRSYFKQRRAAGDSFEVNASDESYAGLTA